VALARRPGGTLGQGQQPESLLVLLSEKPVDQLAIGHLVQRVASASFTSAPT
jgi:hypothetical protein